MSAPTPSTWWWSTADGLRAGAITGFATSAIREARNGLDVLGRVRETTGVTIKVLPGVEEARLTYLAARRWTAFSARLRRRSDIPAQALPVPHPQRRPGRLEPH
jgi:hypothetical protein